MDLNKLSLIQLEELKNEAYSRPERYPFERLGLLLAWMRKAIEDAQLDLKELQNNE